MPNTRNLLPIVVAVGLAVGACDPSSESAFIQGKSLVPCLQQIPACEGLYAACELNETTYAQVRFPAGSPFRFMVSARADETVAVTMFFLSAADAGLDTRIYWNEPGCSDVYSYESDGENLFIEAEETNTITRDMKVLDPGDHLIEIFTDLQAETLVAVDVEVPGAFD